MGRMIDADDLQKKVQRWYGREDFSADGILSIVESEIINAPTIEEHKIGKWAVNEVGVIRCPFCHANMNPRKNRKPKYCDECGAKLEGE